MRTSPPLRSASLCMAFLLTACVSLPGAVGQSGYDTAPGVAPAHRGPPRGNGPITREEVEASTQTDAYRLVYKARPGWLRARSPGGILDLLDGLPPAFNTPEIRVDCPDEIKFAVTDRVRDRLGREYSINDVDGVRVKFADGWGLVRASNTQPALVLRFEASSAALRDQHRKLVEDIVAEARAAVEAGR